VSRVSLRLRIALAFALAMAFLLASVGTFLYIRLAADLSRSLDLELHQRAQDLSAVVSAPGARLDDLAATGLVERGESFAQVQRYDGQVLESTSSLGGQPLLRPRELARVRHRAVALDRSGVHGLDEPARLLAIPVGGTRRPAVLTVGATLQNRAEALDSLRNQLFIGGPVTLLAASIGGYLLAGAALRPVEAMRQRAATISASGPGQRLPLPHTRDELARLGATLNDMLARLEASVDRERNFVADASHELRTPLALLKTELELALRHPRPATELQAAIESAMEETDRLARLADDLLLIARADQGRLPVHLQHLNLRDVITRVTATFAARAATQHRSLSVDVDGEAAVTGDPLRLEQALRNLLDNAFVHGTGAIQMRVNSRTDTVELHVTDEGPGFPVDYLPHAFERFSRSDTARSSGSTGLGLSIVAAIAEAHNGTAHAANRTTSGADLWLTLPGTRIGSPT
jgi:two-component system OmpR family sensor kinase